MFHQFCYKYSYRANTILTSAEILIPCLIGGFLHIQNRDNKKIKIQNTIEKLMEKTSHESQMTLLHNIISIKDLSDLKTSKFIFSSNIINKVVKKVIKHLTANDLMNLKEFFIELLQNQYLADDLVLNVHYIFAKVIKFYPQIFESQDHIIRIFASMFKD